MSLSATALTTLGRASEYSGLDSADPMLITLINAASAKIESWLGRKILSQSFSETYDVPGPEGILVLNQSDVTAVGYLAIDTNGVMTIAYSGSDTNARVEVTDVSLIQVSRAGATTTTTTSTFASNATTAALATAASAVGGWTATALSTVPSAYLVRSGVISAKSSTVTLRAWEDYNGSYTTDYKAGLIYFGAVQWPSRSDASMNFNCYGQCRVDYTAGLSTVPADVELVCLQLVAEAANQAGGSGEVESESLGDYSVSYAESVVSGAELTPEWAAFLAPYMRRMP